MTSAKKALLILVVIYQQRLFGTFHRDMLLLIGRTGRGPWAAAFARRTGQSGAHRLTKTGRASVPGLPFFPSIESFHNLFRQKSRLNFTYPLQATAMMQF